MSVSYLILYFLAAFGFAWVAGHSSASRPMREWMELESNLSGWWGFLLALVECPGCLGVWTGAAAGLVGWLWLDLSGLVALALPWATAAVNIIVAKRIRLID